MGFNSGGFGSGVTKASVPVSGPDFKTQTNSLSLELIPGSTQYGKITSVPTDMQFEVDEDFSVFAWVKLKNDLGGADVRRVISNRRASNAAGWEILIDEVSNFNYLRVILSNGAQLLDLRSTRPIPKDRWMLVGFTYNGSVGQSDSELKLYTDETGPEPEFINANNLLTGMSHAEPYYLGSFHNLVTAGLWDGWIADTMIFNSVLTDEEVVDMFNDREPASPINHANLIHWWKMGESDIAPAATDSKGGADWTLFGGAAFDAEFSAANIWSAYSTVFDGVDDYGEIANPSSVSFDSGVPWSVSFWSIKGGSGTKFILDNLTNDAALKGYELRHDTSRRLQLLMISDFPSTNYMGRQCSVGMTTGALEHWVVTVDNSTTSAGIKFYLNGALQGSANLFDNLTGSVQHSSPARIGSRPGSALNRLNSWIDEFAIYDKELSLAEVQAIYNSGTKHDLKLLPTNPNLARYWRVMDGSATDLTKWVDDKGNGDVTLNNFSNDRALRRET